MQRLDIKVGTHVVVRTKRHPRHKIGINHEMKEMDGRGAFVRRVMPFDKSTHDYVLRFVGDAANSRWSWSDDTFDVLHVPKEVENA